jgi:glycosyltransferase involved in cell wall biosynthesis
MLERSPLISCIMPTYGRPEFLGEAVAMFLAQDYPEKELVILNRCSLREKGSAK